MQTPPAPRSDRPTLPLGMLPDHRTPSYPHKNEAFRFWLGCGSRIPGIASSIGSIEMMKILRQPGAVYYGNFRHSVCFRQHWCSAVSQPDVELKRNEDLHLSERLLIRPVFPIGTPRRCGRAVRRMPSLLDAVSLIEVSPDGGGEASQRGQRKCNKGLDRGWWRFLYPASPLTARVAQRSCRDPVVGLLKGLGAGFI